jgi:hypothetical protein
MKFDLAGEVRALAYVVLTAVVAIAAALLLEGIANLLHYFGIR